MTRQVGTGLILLVLFLVTGLYLLTVPGLTPAASAMPAFQGTGSQRYVQVGGTDAGDCTNAASPCGTITFALNASVAGSLTMSDTIFIAPGTYHENLTIRKYIILQGQSSSGSATVVDGSGSRVILVDAPRVTINNLTIQNGNATSLTPSVGGGIYISRTAEVTLRNSFVVNNTATGGGGIFSGNSTLLNVIRSSFSNNAATTGQGGAISDDVGSTTLITISAIITNSATAGGGIYSIGSLTVVNSTISDNSTTSGNGGGINAGGTVSLNNVTVSNNTAGSSGGASGGGIFVSGGTTTLQNTILAGNTGASGTVDCAGTLNSSGYNLIGSGNSTCTFNSLVSDQLNTNALLGPLTSNGSYTMYRMPQTGTPHSPAIDSGNPSGCTDGNLHVLTVDQRNAVRPQPAGGNCDVGSVEAGNAPALSNISPSSKMASSPGFLMTLTGLNFSTSSAQVIWVNNGVTTTLAPASRTGTQITVNIPGSLITFPGTANVSVQNSLSDPNSMSGALPFTILTNPAQLLEYLPYIAK